MPFKSIQKKNILNGVRFLETLVALETMTSPYTMAVVSYALARAKSPVAETVFEKLLSLSIKEGNLQYWTDGEENVNVYSFTHNGPHLATSMDVMITSYVILTYISLHRLEEALPAVRWLTAQKNPMGGFVSSQDTVLGLKALSTFASNTFRKDTDVTIVVTDAATTVRMNITSNNALTLQIKELKEVSDRFNIRASGVGVALVDIDYRFNSLKELSTPGFEVNTVLLDDRLDIFNLMVCTKMLLKHNSTLVIQEVSIPSGFVPDLSSLGKISGIKDVNKKGDVVVVYYDKINRFSICYSIVMTREAKVARSQKNFIRTYEYHEPSNQAILFYQPKAIRDATIKDICPNCFINNQNKYI